MVKSAASIKADVDRVGRGGARRRTVSGALRKPSTRMTPLIVNNLVVHYAEGKSIRECADLADVAYGTARRALLAAGVVLRPRGGGS